MVITQIVKFSGNSSLEAQADVATRHKILETTTSLQSVKGPQHFAFGRDAQDETKAQLTCEWSGVQDYQKLPESAEFKSFIAKISKNFGEAQSICHFNLNNSAFGTDGAATARLVEYAGTDYPTSRATADFQKQIEQDFIRFEGIFKRESQGDRGVAFGWTLDDYENEEIKSEKARSFLVIKGWDSMEQFQESCQTNAAKEALPILYAWNAPSFKIWHIERKD